MEKTHRGNIVQDMCSVAGIECYKTNHSLTATTCTIGLEKGVPEKLIMEGTRHRTVKSLHTYQKSERHAEGNFLERLCK